MAELLADLRSIRRLFLFDMSPGLHIQFRPKIRRRRPLRMDGIVRLMKRGWLAVMPMFGMTSAYGQTLKPDDLADKLISVFRAGDYESYRTLLLDSTDFKALISDFSKHNHLSASGQANLLEREKKFADSADIRYHKEFERLMSKGRKLGIDWTQIKKVDFVFKERLPENSEIKSLSGYLNVVCEDSLYVFFGIEATKLPSGYKISSIRTILKGGIKKYINPDLLDDEDL